MPAPKRMGATKARARAHTGRPRPDEAAHAVLVRAVAEVADEEQVLALFEGEAARVRAVDGRDDDRGDARGLAPHHVEVCGGGEPDEVGRARKLRLKLPVALGLARERAVARQLRLAREAHEVQVDGVEDDLHARVCAANRPQDTRRHLGPADDGRPEPARLHQAAQPERGGRLDALLPEELLVLGPDLLARGDEDGVAPLGERAQDVEHAQTPRVAVGRRDAVVDDGDLRGPAAVRGALGAFGVLRVVLAREHRAPLRVELVVVDDLVAAEARARVGAGRPALEVVEARGRLVDDLVAERAHAHAEVCVLVVGGRVAPVEAAEPLEQLAPDEERRARAVVPPAREGEASVFGRAEPAVLVRLAVRPDDGARLLYAPVRVEEERADGARARVALDGLAEGSDEDTSYD